MFLKNSWVAIGLKAYWSLDAKKFQNGLSPIPIEIVSTTLLRINVRQPRHDVLHD